MLALSSLFFHQSQPSPSPPAAHPATSALDRARKNSSRLAGVSENRCCSSTTEAATGVGAGGTGAAEKAEAEAAEAEVGVVGGFAAKAASACSCCCFRCCRVEKSVSGEGSCGVGGGVAAAEGAAE